MDKEKQKILIVGAGIAGLTAALDLAREDTHCIVVEKGKQMGGHGASFNCKAVGGKCQKCGACLVDDAIGRVLETPLIEVYLETQVKDLRREKDGFKAGFDGKDPPSSMSFEAVLFCHGFVPFDPSQKPNLRYGDIPNIITGLALEGMLREKGEVVRPSDLGRPEKIAFIQCVGSRDTRLGSPYCSQVCCGYALRMARLIKSKNPEIDVTCFYMDMQTFGKDFHDIWPNVKDDVLFIREIPGDFYRTDGDRVGVTVEVNDEVKDLVFDLIILSVGMKPGPGQSVTNKWFNTELGPEGFMLPYQGRGILAVGSATGPMNIVDTIAHAHASVNELMIYLENKNESRAY